MPQRPDILNMRLDPTTRALMDALADRFGLSRSAVVRQAIRRWAHAESVEVPQEPEQGKAAA
jgi:DNA-binding GntR family transcriptional regulator